MNIQEVRDYCMQMDGVCEEFPFDDNTLVFKLCNKMFLLIPRYSRMRKLLYIPYNQDGFLPSCLPPCLLPNINTHKV